MTNSITPPPELVEQWYDACVLEGAITYDEYKFAAFAAQWGADQELEACCEWLALTGKRPGNLRAARRPEPPSLKERSLQLLETYNTSGVMLTADQADTIRRALEALPNG